MADLLYALAALAVSLAALGISLYAPYRIGRR